MNTWFESILSIGEFSVSNSSLIINKHFISEGTDIAEKNNTTLCVFGDN